MPERISISAVMCWTDLRPIKPSGGSLRIQEAVEGVYSGKYYAALVIPENFTKDMIGFLGGTVELYPAITYYENDKKNAIAPKRFTAKAKTAVQEQVNASFISTITDAMVGAGKVLTATDNHGDNRLIRNQYPAGYRTELQVYIAVMSSFVDITDAAQGLIDASQNMLPGVRTPSDRVKWLEVCRH